MLVDGRWVNEAQRIQTTDAQGRFMRQASTFRNWVTRDGAPGPTGAGGFRAEPHRYHLYVALNCPWACRTLIYRKLKKLEDVISLSIAIPTFTEQGYSFGDYPGSIPDPLYNIRYIHELYTRADPHYTGRATVPVLWDKMRQTIVNNESSEIIRMLNHAFDAFGDASVDFYPQELRAEIDALNERIYEGLNNGVYRAGFATSQAAYEEAVRDVFACLDELEQRLVGRSYLLGERITETDWRAFVTLIRFDMVYHGLFKCNVRRLLDYPRLSAYLKRLYDIPGVADTVDFHHIKRTYYSIPRVNPSGIVPIGPEKIFA
ncbi:MAG TPA: glutathione S-transferase family protein [Methylomirabilota bacterium]|jgi:putative glutathione S-transferase|nr:glutathione S-transferase family protein [Methylomirabilota bacterium]